MSEEKKIPKVFISYSWKPEEDKEFVKEIADRLISESRIDVLIDRYDLSPGDDKYAYMEKMVTDESVDKVLIFSNCEYTRKADKREGGVGTESTIISQEVYKKVTQNKFIPILLEKNEKDEPCFPTFIKSRIYIDFSDVAKIEDEYEKLVRFIYNKPLDKKPSLAEKTPSYITEEDPLQLKVHYKLERFKNAVIEGRRNIPVLIEDYLDNFIEDVSKLKIEDNKEDIPPDQKVYDIILITKSIRDNFLNFFELLIKLNEDDYKEILHKHIESWSELINLEDDNYNTETKRCSQHYKFLFKELFLYLITIAIQKEKFNLVIYLLTTPYWVRIKSEEYKNRDFTYLYTHIKSLDADRKSRIGSLQKSIATDILVERMDYKKTNLNLLQETDRLFHYLSLLSEEYSFWFPYLTMYYVGDISFMKKAESKIYFDKIKGTFKVENVGQLKEKINNIPRRKRDLYDHNYNMVDIAEGLNVNNLAKY
jgi:hypothetical protein